jgi:2,5-diamino-6-(ribosylamino)-4(3H)-pyrimidinone 5'-phosphate reductase
MSPRSIGYSEVKVILICASTICGRISPAGLAGFADRRLLEEMRDRTGASLIGAGTLRESDPEMRGAGGLLAEDRIRAVITASGNIPFRNRKLFQVGPPPLILTGAATTAMLQDELGTRARVRTLPAGAGGLSIRAALETLQDMGADSVLIEGGAGLNYAALKAGVVDEISLTIAPRISGDRTAPSMADGPGPLGNPFLELALLSCQQVESGEIFLRYRVHPGKDSGCRCKV